VAFSPQANYTDRATAACRRSQCQLLRIEVVAWSAQRIPTAVNPSFQDRSRYYFIQVAPQLSSRGWVDPVPDPLLLIKSGGAGNRTRDLWICSQELWPLDHRVLSSIFSVTPCFSSFGLEISFITIRKMLVVILDQRISLRLLAKDLSEPWV
jgi:hypothetical protein